MVVDLLEPHKLASPLLVGPLMVNPSLEVSHTLVVSPTLVVPCLVGPLLVVLKHNSSKVVAVSSMVVLVEERQSNFVDHQGNFVGRPSIF